MPNILATIGSVYRFLDATGGGFYIVGAVFALFIGILITGHGAAIVQTKRGDTVLSEEYRPASPGLARSPVGKFVGVIITISGMCLFCLGVVSCAANVHWP